MFPLFALTLSAPAHAEVVFRECTEHVGIVLVPIEDVSPYLPTDFDGSFGYGAFGTPPGPASVIVRTARCEDTTIDGVDVGRVVTSQIGVVTAVADAELLDLVIDGDGIDNYTIAFSTDTAELDDWFDDHGVPSTFDAKLSVEFDEDDDGVGVEAEAKKQPKYELEGQLGLVAPYGQGFVADWWADDEARTLARTIIPDISFAFSFFEGAVTLDPNNGSQLADLVGSGPVAFDISLVGVFEEGTLEITETEPGS